jgi:hypothetical protein
MKGSTASKKSTSSKTTEKVAVEKKSSSKKKPVEREPSPEPVEYDESNSQEEDEPSTPESLEEALVQTINEFGTFISSITKDLETREDKTIKQLEKKGMRIPARLWEDSTWKVDLLRKLLLNVFKGQYDRLMKYYIVILLPMKRWISKRREKFFLKAQVFPGAPEADIKFFRDLWAIDGTMSDKEKNICWDFWDTQIEIVEDWQDLTGWVVNDQEDLDIPNIDYEKAARDADISDSE